MKTVMLAFFIGAAAASAQNEIKLWADEMPGASAARPEGLKPDRGDGVVRLTNVSEPTLSLYLVDSEKPVPFVIICPGGGYSILCMDKEGAEAAAWLNSVGVSATVLKYRVPKNRAGALEDAKQAVRLAREHSGDWNIDAERIGMLGFSAGGHLTAVCSNSDVRPDFSVLVYPAYLYKKDSIELVDEIRVDAETPPAFVVQTKDDKKYYRSALSYAAALDASGVEVEMHLFAKGGHGYGLRPSAHPVSQWPKLCEAWMREMEFIR